MICWKKCHSGLIQIHTCIGKGHCHCGSGGLSSGLQSMLGLSQETLWKLDAQKRNFQHLRKPWMNSIWCDLCPWSSELGGRGHVSYVFGPVYYIVNCNLYNWLFNWNMKIKFAWRMIRDGHTHCNNRSPQISRYVFILQQFLVRRWSKLIA